MPLNEALGVSMDLRKVLFIALLVSSFFTYSIVPNDEYYKLADTQISQLSSELKEIESSLKLNPNNEVVIKLKSNLEKEIKLIKQRVKLFKKLERSGLIMYSNSQNSEQETPKKWIMLFVNSLGILLAGLRPKRS